MNCYTCFIYLLNTCLFFVYLVVPLPIVLSTARKLFLFTLTFLIVALLSPYGQITATLGISILFLTVTLLSPRQLRLLCLCCSMWGYLCTVISQYLCINLADLLLHLSHADLGSRYIIPFSLANLVLLYGILRFFQYLFRKKWRLTEMNLSGRVLLLCFFCLITCTVIFITNFTYGEQIGYPSSMVRLNTVLFLAFFCLVGLLLVVIVREIQKSHDYQTRLEYFQAAQEYSLSLDTAYKEIRKFKHDYKNLFLGLSCYLDAGDLPGMKNYFSRTLLPLCENIDSSFEQSALALLEIPEVRGLCLAKAQQAKSKGISIKFFIPSPAASLRMDMMDLLRLLGIYFDNAIEAAEKADAKKIEFRLFPNGDSRTLTLANTYNDTTLTLERLSTPGYTTKGEDHGKGLSIAGEIFKRYPSIEHTALLREGYLIQEIHQL